jgi:hypothetical protein
MASYREPSTVSAATDWLMTNTRIARTAGMVVLNIPQMLFPFNIFISFPLMYFINKKWQEVLYYPPAMYLRFGFILPENAGSYDSQYNWAFSCALLVRAAHHDRSGTAVGSDARCGDRKHR